jgi:hypothetical protein
MTDHVKTQLMNGVESLRDMIAMQSDNQLFLLAISGAVSAVTLEAVQRFTHILSTWANSATGLAWFRDKFTFNILGGKLDVSKLIGVVIYILVALFFLAVVVFGILGPLILAQSHEYDKDNDNKNEDVKEQRK